MAINDFVAAAQQRGYKPEEINKFLLTQLTGPQKAVEQIPTVGGWMGAAPASLVGLGPYGGILGQLASQPIREAGRVLTGSPIRQSPDDYIRELPGQFASGGVKGFGSQLGVDFLRALPNILATLPIVGGPIRQRMGDNIEDQMLKEGASSVPASSLKRNLQEKTYKYQSGRTPELQDKITKELDAINQEAARSSIPGNIEMGEIQRGKGVAYEKAYEKTAPANERNLQKIFGSVYKEAQQDIASPELKKLLEDYGKVQVGRETVGGVGAAFKRLLPWMLGWELFRRAKGVLGL